MSKIQSTNLLPENATPRNTASLLVQNYINTNVPPEEQRNEWDDLAAFEQAVGTGILDIHESIVKNVGMLDAVGYKSDELVNATKTYEVDFTNIVNDLETIGKMHEGKTGPAKSNEEYAQSIDLFEKYRQLDVTMRASFLPVCTTITESLLVARDNLIKQGFTPDNIDEKLKEVTAQEATDPNVITDVEVK